MKIKEMLLLFIVLAFSSHVFGAELTIIVNKGPFDTVEHAAEGERNVNFLDSDLADDRACTECFAAVELKNFLIRVTGLKDEDIKFDDSNKMPHQGDVFVLGSQASNGLIAEFDKNKDFDFNSDQSFNIHALKQDGRKVTIIQGADRVGTLYGVYEYLNKLGIHFFGLAEQGTVYPDNQVALLNEIDETQNPDYLNRGFTVNLFDTPHLDPNEIHIWMARNKLNYWTMLDPQKQKLKKLGFNLQVGQHTNQILYLNPKNQYPYNHPKFKGDEKKTNDPYKISDQYKGDNNGDGKLSYFEAHPEWYGLQNGKRSDYFKWDGHNFCTSNADAAAEYSKNIVASIVSGDWKYADFVKFSMFDSQHAWCQCDSCKAQGNITDRYLRLVDIVLKEIDNARRQGKLNRKIKLVPSAYQETIYPPTKPLPQDFDYDNCLMTFAPIGRCYEHTFSDNSCQEANQNICNIYSNWAIDSARYYKGEIIIVEYYNVSSFMSLPAVFTKIMSSDIPWYFKNGASHFNYMHTPVERWGTWTVNQYLMARLLWDVSIESDDVIDEFYRLYYPTTYETTKAFYSHLEKAAANLKAIKHFLDLKNDVRYHFIQRWGQRLTLKDKPIFWIDHLKYEPKKTTVNDALSIVEMLDEMKKAGNYIDQSLLNCSDEKEQARLIDADRRFDYGEKMYKFIYHLTRTSILFHKDNDQLAKVEFAKAKIYAELLRQITDMANVTYNSGSQEENGLKASQAVEVYEFFDKKYGK